jgi:N-acetyl-anhydromuramyl-L-alanine amidase AmpD
MVNIAVQAAEQIYNGRGRGAEKKAYVLEFLRSKGYTLDMESVENLIEAAVFALQKQFEPVIDSTDVTPLTAACVCSFPLAA